MKIYKISCDYKFALGDIVKSSQDVEFLSLDSETVDLLDKFNFDWSTNESSALPNITIIVSELFCLDEKSTKKLIQHLNGIHFNPILIGKERFTSLSNIPTMENVLDLKSSKVKLFSTGDIMEITHPVFKNQYYPNLFKIDEIGRQFYCSEELKNVIIFNNLTGIIFHECKVKSKSWFKLS